MPYQVEKQAPPVKVEIWKSRFDAQFKVLDELYKSLVGNGDKSVGNGNTSIDRQELFTKMLMAIRSFGESQFRFFYNGFGFGNENPYLEYSSETPPEFVLRSVLDQLAYDTSVLERSINQRRDLVMRDALRKADVLAHKALEPALGANGNGLLSSPARAITYFQKVPEVLVVPYANIALIGIPYASIGEAGTGLLSDLRDYLAIPHEVGHYVFWRGVTSEGRLFVLLRQKLINAGLSSYLHWLEEIFADVYGCLIGGPVMGLSIQDLQFDNLPARFTEDDGEHPVAAIRPYIHAQVLRNIGDQKSAEILEEQWKNKLAVRGNPSSFNLRPGTGPEETVATARGKQQLVKIVDNICDLLKQIQFPGDWGGTLPTEFAKPESWYENFTAKLQDESSSLNSKRFSRLPLDKFDAPGVGSSWANTLRKWRGKAGAQPASIWTAVFNADGWGPGGGEGDGNGKGLE